MAGKTLQLRCQTKSGKHSLTGLTLASTVGYLKDLIAEVANLPKDSIQVRLGYPPKVIDLSNETQSLFNISLKSGDTLIVDEDKSIGASQVSKTSQSESASGSYHRDATADQMLCAQITNCPGILTRKVVPADNSCLFTSIYMVMNNGEKNTSCAATMREYIASFVKSDQETYNQGFLGKKNSDYCKWIRNSKAWGGAIEISILAKYYAVEIDVIDTQSGRIDRFGEDQNYLQRVLILYDGIHYDALIFEPSNARQQIQTIFPITDDFILAQALEIASEAKASKQFTDVNKFSLRCLICQTSLIGNTEAMQHAQDTGHVSFGECN